MLTRAFVNVAVDKRRRKQRKPIDIMDTSKANDYDTFRAIRLSSPPTTKIGGSPTPPMGYVSVDVDYRLPLLHKRVLREVSERGFQVDFELDIPLEVRLVQQVHVGVEDADQITDIYRSINQSIPLQPKEDT